MKTAVIALILALSMPAVAADYTLRDRSGRTVEAWQRQSATTTVRDQSGLLIGTMGK
jgi:hypothetical protein